MRHAALALLAGCSFTFMHGSETARCQLEAPVTDTVIAAVASTAAVVVANLRLRGDACPRGTDGTPSDCGEPEGFGPPTIVLTSVAVVETASAVYGFAHRSGCHATRDTLATR